MNNNPLPRLDENEAIRQRLLPFCRLRPGECWIDEKCGHRVGCIDATDADGVLLFSDGLRPVLAVHDPPYNLIAFASRSVSDYVRWCRSWVEVTARILSADASLYVWLGADQGEGFQPLPDFMIMMRSSPFRPRSFITMRNQRGYGTLHNWMAIRQELLYYVRGKPVFNVDAEYTDIPKILRGYYKTVGGELTENLQRSRSDTIRAGNVWVDVQQVFYRMDENVSGCYAQKPLAAIERIVRASSNRGDAVIDLFGHSGTTLLACERLRRVCVSGDIDPIYCEIMIRRLEHFRINGRLGWQNGHPFEREAPAFALDEASPADMSSLPEPSLFEIA